MQCVLKGSISPFCPAVQVQVPCIKHGKTNHQRNLNAVLPCFRREHIDLKSLSGVIRGWLLCDGFGAWVGAGDGGADGNGTDGGADMSSSDGSDEPNEEDAPEKSCDEEEGEEDSEENCNGDVDATQQMPSDCAPSSDSDED